MRPARRSRPTASGSPTTGFSANSVTSTRFRPRADGRSGSPTIPLPTSSHPGPRTVRSSSSFIADGGRMPHLWIAPVSEGRPAGPAVRITNDTVFAYSPPPGRPTARESRTSARRTSWIVPPTAAGPAEESRRERRRRRFGGIRRRLAARQRKLGRGQRERPESLPRSTARSEPINPRIFMGPGAMRAGRSTSRWTDATWRSTARTTKETSGCTKPRRKPFNPIGKEVETCR